MNIKSENVSIPVGNDSMPAYVARPEGNEKLPAVIVWMEIFGVNSHIQEVTDRVAREGYIACAPNFFHRVAPELNLGYDEAGMNEGIGHMMKLTADNMIADQKAAITYLRGRDDIAGDKIGAMGFCIGGHMTYLTACENDIAAAASFYGGGIAAPEGPGGAPSTISRTANINCPVLCLFGALDAHIPAEQTSAVEAALKDSGRDGEVVIYDNAEHGFFCDQRASYNAASAADAWTRVKDLFEQNLR
jgi:carboxymethylenebutenolidase